MLPQSQPRKKRNSSKVNLMISFAFHALIVLVALYFAARQGLLGKQMKKISIEMVKEKPPEKPKEPEKPKVEPPKMEPPRWSRNQSGGGSQGRAATGQRHRQWWRRRRRNCRRSNSKAARRWKPVPTRCYLYKGYLEYALRSKWQRPDNVADDNYVAEVAVTVDRTGQISNPVWEKGSGDAQWDDSVKAGL